MSDAPSLSRRGLLAAAGGLLVSVSMRPAQGADEAGALPGSLKTAPLLDAWIRIEPDGAVTAFTGKVELGQGLRTALTQIVAEQLDVPLARVALVTADTARTANEGFTAGSNSMKDSGTALLFAAAHARRLLLEAAAAELNVPVESLTVADGVVHAPDGATRAYGALAARLDTHVQIGADGGAKDPAAYRIMGQSVPRLDIPADDSPLRVELKLRIPV